MISMGMAVKQNSTNACTFVVFKSLVLSEALKMDLQQNIGL